MRMDVPRPAILGDSAPSANRLLQPSTQLYIAASIRPKQRQPAARRGRRIHLSLVALATFVHGSLPILMHTGPSYTSCPSCPSCPKVSFIIATFQRGGKHGQVAAAISFNFHPAAREVVCVCVRVRMGKKQ